MTTTPPITLGAWNVEADDPEGLGSFWAGFLGVTPHLYAGMAYLPADEAGGVPMMFHPRGGPRPERQDAHLDLTVPWGRRVAEVERAVALGAVHRWDVLDEHPHVRWSVVADPEGNLFCVAEHPPAE
ncbi:VOC family protein [Nesterenkonia sp. F]|uniref:VOC family protein n=1 Tax=Nesterenkonia sp. F TaxID=795955 RepID=UPI000255CAF0|nr:VOC family protein [Nesterenkonia sp. F]